MEKNEHAIFIDIPNGKKNGRFHSAILTTYAIDLIHFDRQLLNILHRKQVCSVNVLVDQDQLETEMEYVNPSFMKNIGKEYSISSIKSLGAFHPKINFFVGDESVLVLFGTGNLTVPGHGKNHETFTGLMIDETDDTHRPLVEECWKYITQFVNQCSIFEKKRILNEVPDNCTFLKNNYNIVPHRLCNIKPGLSAALLYNDNSSSILKQISNIVPLSSVLKITIVSPFFDEKGETLQSLAELCPNAKVEVLIHKGCSLPPCKMLENKRIVFYDFKETNRGKSNFTIYDRQLHAKIFHFKTSESEYCVIGSANATKPGLGTMNARGINDEFCIIYVSNKTDFLGELGLKTRRKIDFKIKDMERLASENNHQSTNKYKILSAQYENEKLSIAYSQTIPDIVTIAVDYGYKNYKFKSSKINKEICIVDTKLERDLSTCYIVNEEGECISNKVFINRIDQLEITNPSKTSRSLNRFISQIENDGYEGLEVIDMLSDIMWELVNESDDTAKPRIGSSSNVTKIKDNILPRIKYNPAYDNDDVHSRHLVSVDRTSRLIDCIEESIRKKIRSIDDALNDEEEEGNAETSNNREIVENEDITVNKKNIKSYADMSNSVLKRYSDLISKRTEQIQSSGLKIITVDDLNFFSLSIFSAVEICYLNRHRYIFDGIDSYSQSYFQKQLYDSLDRSMNSFGLNTVEKFVRFCMSNKPSSNDMDFKKKTWRTMKYAILYATLFFKNATQEEERLLGRKVIQALRHLISIFGLPENDFLENELSPLSERYAYAFRLSHIQNTIRRIMSK